VPSALAGAARSRSATSPRSGWARASQRSSHGLAAPTQVGQHCCIVQHQPRWASIVVLFGCSLPVGHLLLSPCMRRPPCGLLSPELHGGGPDPKGKTFEGSVSSSHSLEPAAPALPPRRLPPPKVHHRGWAKPHATEPSNAVSPCSLPTAPPLARGPAGCWSGLTACRRHQALAAVSPPSGASQNAWVYYICPQTTKSMYQLIIAMNLQAAPTRITRWRPARRTASGSSTPPR
jgi:hypothetical protein